MVTSIPEAVALLETICAQPGTNRLIENTRRYARREGLDRAVREHDTPALYGWLMSGFSHQGIADAIADAYIARHGNAEWTQLKRALASKGRLCPKLRSFGTYRSCGYRKSLRTCGNSKRLTSCPGPTLPLRKGSLNEQAFSLFLFLRDRCEGDLVGFIDRVMATAADDPDPVSAQREVLLAAFEEVYGVSRKLLSVMFADLLIGADPRRRGWVGVGASMVAVDSLVHNFLHRTGILAAYGGEHSYGQRCYGERGCEAILRDLADRIDARSLNPRYPSSFPRLVQYAIWRFCAASAFNICNGGNIPRTHVCKLSWCPVWDRCSRLPLKYPFDPDGP